MLVPLLLLSPANATPSVYTAPLERIPKRRVQRAIGSFRVSPAVDLVHVPVRDLDAAAFEARVVALEAEQGERDVQGWLRRRRQLEDLRRSRPAALEGGELRARIEAMILEAAEASGDESGIYEAERTLAQLLTTEPDLIGSFGEEDRERLRALAETTASSRRYRVTVGQVDAVRWEGLERSVVDGVLEVPEGQWDLVGIRQGQPAWSLRLQVVGKVDVTRVLDERVTQVFELLAEEACSVELPRWVVREGYVWHDRRLWELTPTGARQADGRCQEP